MGFNKQEYAHQCFTDDDLKRLKEALKTPAEYDDCGGEAITAVLSPLLHRLECAEQLAANHTNHEEECILNYFEAGERTPDGGYRQKIKGKWYQSKPIDNTPKCDCGVSEKYEAWLRSKGEGK